MRLHDVDLPQRILDAKKEHNLVLFAGAGVSMDAPSNYPDFADLATGIGGTTFPKHESEAIDRYLGRLEQEGLSVHNRVKQVLSNPDSHPNHLHLAFVRLFGTTDPIRIVTTNFDDHFRAAAIEVNGSEPQIYRAPALPLGDDFTGIVHLHGSVRDNAKNLVLTDADFGRAYLTQGWARRFVQRLFDQFVVLFVGYSHQDLPLLYLARGLSAAADGPGRYALTSPTADTFWLNLGITPVHYPLRAEPLPRHSAVGDCLAKWAEIANLGSLGTEAEIQRIVTSDRPETPEESDFLKQALLHVSTVRYFTRHARDPRWLHWIADAPEFRAIFAPASTLSDISRELAFWFSENFAISHFAIALEFVQHEGQTLSPALWQYVAGAFHRRGAAGDPLRFWTPVLLESAPANAYTDLLAYMIGHCTIPEDQHTILQLFRRLTSPNLRLSKRFYPAEDGKPAVPMAEVVTIGRDDSLTRTYTAHLRPHIGSLAIGLAPIVTSAFEEARTLLLMYGKVSPTWDPISSSRGSTASRVQDHMRNGFSILVDAGVDVLNWANEHSPKFAAALIAQWIASDAPILRRLAITGMTHHAPFTPDEKLSWAITNGLLEDIKLKNEMFALLAQVYAAGSEDLRVEFLASAETAYGQEGDHDDQYELFNLLSWLSLHAPNCDLVAKRLKRVQDKHPEWRMREHPDFNSWIGGGVRQLVRESPVPVSEIENMNLEDLSTECARLATVTDVFGETSKGGFLQEIARTAAQNFGWSEGIAGEALASQEPPTEIWSALIRGWSSSHVPEEWTSVIRTLARLEPIYGAVLYEIASLLKDGIGCKTGDLPRALLEEALAIAKDLWSVCAHEEKPMPDASDDWVTVVINRTSGHLLEVWFEALKFLWPSRDQEQATIRSILDAFSGMIAGQSPGSEAARVLVSANVLLVSAFGQDWYEANILPLLSAPASRTSEQVWDGFLLGGGWTQEMLPGMLPAYLSRLPSITVGADKRSRMYCDHLAGVAVFGIVNPIENGWLDAFLVKSSRRERLHWLAGVTQTLRSADQQAKDSAWDRWLYRYLGRRVQADPIPLDAEESGAMCEWALELKSHYAEIVELLLTGPAPKVKGTMFYFRLYEEGTLPIAPVATIRLLTALLSQEDGKDMWEWDQIHEMVVRLIELNPAEPTLRPLCERLGDLGSQKALEFSNRLR